MVNYTVGYNWKSVGVSALKGEILNMLCRLIGAYGGVELTVAENFVMSIMLNTITSGYNVAIDLFRNYLKEKRKRESYAY